MSVGTDSVVSVTRTAARDRGPLRRYRPSPTGTHTQTFTCFCRTNPMISIAPPHPPFACSVPYSMAEIERATSNCNHCCSDLPFQRIDTPRLATQAASSLRRAVADCFQPNQRLAPCTREWYRQLPSGGCFTKWPRASIGGASALRRDRRTIHLRTHLCVFMLSTPPAVVRALL